MNTTLKALNAYSQVDLESAVNSASPVQLVVLLYDGAIGALAAAKGQMQQMRFAEKGRLISKAIEIIEGLRMVLDHEKGGVIAKNLNDLYEYMKNRLTVANLKNDPEGPAEVIRLLTELRSAWMALSERERGATVPTAAPSRDNVSLRA